MHPSIEPSLKHLLTVGSDSRIVIADGGLNRYGCTTEVRDAIPFGSCTCSSPSTRGIQRAGDLLDRLRRSSSAEAEAESVYQEHRSRLRSLLTLPDQVEIAFAPSGTDAELLVLALARMLRPQRIVNIVVGPTEVGSGTPAAAGGKHYDDVVPRGDQVISGDPICPEFADGVDVQNVEIRDESGNMLEEALIDAMVTSLVVDAIESGAQVLLHVVAHSKTGMHAPSLDCIERISRHLPDDVAIVIDAAQGRVSRRGLREALALGYMVMLTGSKFYGGPPFSGALLIPPNLQPSLVDDRLKEHRLHWKHGLSQYFTPFELPPAWTTIRGWMHRWVNFGALLRWEAAIAEIEAYYQVPDDDRLRVLRTFEIEVPRLFSDSEFIKMMPAFPLLHDDVQTRLLESKTTVFAFRVQSGDRMLNRDEMAELHRLLNRAGQSSDHRQSKQLFHLGQPVRFRDGSAALRIALGGELIVRIATDKTMGETLDDRLNWLREQLNLLRSRLETLIAGSSISSKSNQSRTGH